MFKIFAYESAGIAMLGLGVLIALALTLVI
jgi:hypothetical protein